MTTLSANLDCAAAGAAAATPGAAPHPWLAELRARLSPATILRADEPLAKRTTLRVGGRADFYAEPVNERELTTLVQWCAERRLPWFLLGRGSNLLIRDGGLRGLVVCLAAPAFSAIDVVGNHLHCGAGARLKQVAMTAKQRALTGLEFLEGIPGSVGGALRMNAGAMGSWTFDVVESLRYMDAQGGVHEAEVAEVAVEYRCCPLLRENIALGAVLRGHPSSREVVNQRLQTFNKKRWDSQPAAPSAGCIFKNPTTVPAGKLIDELGLKGTRVGQAMVSQEHGNFIVNEGGATAREVLDLIELIRARARQARGIDLHTEVEIVGED